MILDGRTNHQTKEKPALIGRLFYLIKAKNK